MSTPLTANENVPITMYMASNGHEVKLSWLRFGVPTKPLGLKAETLRRRSQEVRSALNKLCEYFISHPPGNEQADPGWQRYSTLVRELQETGTGLYNTLLDDRVELDELESSIKLAPRGQELVVHVTDEDVTLPFGFIFDGAIQAPAGPPDPADFAGFWLHKLRITLIVQNSGTAPAGLEIDRDAFRALFAMHRAELGAAFSLMSLDEQSRLRRLMALPLQDHYDWQSAGTAWETATGNIFFVLAHSDGDALQLGDSRIDSGTFLKKFRRDKDGPSTLLLLNCCLSASGAEGSSLLSTVARPGFTGLVGTEAEILNTFALRCGAQLMWGLCALGQSLGEALDAMRASRDLFPFNLFYTCYANRDFRLSAPIDALCK